MESLLCEKNMTSQMGLQCYVIYNVLLVAAVCIR